MSGKTMAEEGFLRRWSRLKSTGGEPAAPAPVPASACAPAPSLPQAVDAAPGAQAETVRPLPTLDDVATLSFESDYSGFVAQGVDKAVRRLALKKLFSDPHFKVMDGLDIYIDDYNIASPVAADMLAELRHADSALARVLEDEEQVEEAGGEGGEAPPQLEPEPALELEQAPPAQSGNPQENPQGNA